VVSAKDQGNILLELKADPACCIEGGKVFRQHFCFTISGLSPTPLCIKIINAGEAMCADDLNGYQCVCADGEATADPAGNGSCWKRINTTTFDGKVLRVEHSPAHVVCTYGLSLGCLRVLWWCTLDARTQAVHHFHPWHRGRTLVLWWCSLDVCTQSVCRLMNVCMLCFHPSGMTSIATPIG
jgi:hypothetical protein